MIQKLLQSKAAVITLCTLLIAAVCVTVALLLPKDTATETIASSSESEPSSSSETPVSSEEAPSSSEFVSSAPPPEFKITSHRSTDVTVWEPFTVFSGVSDPAEKLLLNGKELSRDDKGAFSAEFTLTVGNNKFTFEHKGKTYTYIVRYRFDVMQSFSPEKAQSFESGSTFAVTVTARVGSTVKATFAGNTVTLVRDDTQGGDEEAATSDTFVKYRANFTLPSDNRQDLDMGVVSITATHSGVTETAKTGKITCKKKVLPTIGEIVAFSAETFDGDTADDASRPTNNYLPEGTVDYVVGRAYNGSKEYLVLRCGRRVYVNKKMVPTNELTTVTREYEGTLPDTNKIAVAAFDTGERYSTLTLDTEWKAPFFLDLLPQKYTKPSVQDYTVSSLTYTYLDITFCYAESVSGEVSVPADHPVFSSAEIITEGNVRKLRLHLKNKGAFYGWNAYYNAEGKLVFEFLHPAQVTLSQNEYGADLTGVKILIDVGHGGKDFGAPGIGNTYFEDERNLFLAKKLRDELEKTGATVILNRETNVTIKADDRCTQLKDLKPDLCIAIHHDSNGSSKPNGFGMYYSTPFSYTAAKYFYTETRDAQIYTPSAAGYRGKLDWHYYFVARMTDCPVVLTENGFMSSPVDRDGIVSEAKNIEKAKAMTRAVADYFLSITTDPTPPESSSSSEPPVSSEPPMSSEPPVSSDADETL
ncbi:MAG: N-acetylmuramoyl-L-alanine amidase [Clostridia bacterium]|nr:N-acetylmuramoyl-L-alanine amidase [Clostridia bacterium]